MRNKEFIKKLLTLPLDYNIKINDEELFSIVSEKTFEENTISLNSPPQYLKDLPKSDDPYDLGHMNSLKKTWINPNETFFLKNDEDKWVGVKFIGEFINHKWWGYQYFESPETDETDKLIASRKAWLDNIINERLEK